MEVEVNERIVISKFGWILNAQATPYQCCTMYSICVGRHRIHPQDAIVESVIVKQLGSACVCV